MVRTAEPEDLVADDLTRRILSSAKYRSLDESLVQRVAADAAHRFRDRNQALKYAKRKLHQAYGAFVNGSPVQAVNEAVVAIRSGQADLRPAMVAAMRRHASSAERAAWLAPFYDQIAEWCGPARSVADLACGLNPLAIPWMRLAPDPSYWACEIDTELVAALSRLDEIMPVRLTVRTCDLVVSPPVLQIDVALLLKTVTTIEQQDPAAPSRVLGALDCRHAILSLPRRSLSGRRSYSEDADEIVRRVAVDSPYRPRDEATFGNEVLYHLTPK